MTPRILKTIGYFFFYFALQIFFVKDFALYDYGFCYIYLGFLLSFPLFLKREYELLLFAATGLTVDVFSNSLGVHMAACTLIGLMRQYVMAWFPPQSGYNSVETPSIRELGLSWYMRYTIILIPIHSFVVIMLDKFSLYSFHISLGKIVASSLFTFVMVIASEYLFFTPKRFKRSL